MATMTKKSVPKKAAAGGSKQLEGEGSYSGTRGYDKGLAEHVRRADVAGLAKKAAQALDGSEGKELKRAEKQAKRGPGRARHAVAR